MKGFVIAIDGPVASGKGTVAELLAHRLNGFHFSTGLTYRALAYYCLQEGIDTQDEEEVKKAAEMVEIEITGDKIVLNARDIGDDLFQNEVSGAASKIATYKDVRKRLVEIQQEIIESHIEKGQAVVVDGRDIGTRVWQEADIKVFLTADAPVRAKRRQSQLLQRGEKKEIEEVIREVNERDKNDTERTIDPLVREPEKYGYEIVDSTGQKEQETLSMIFSTLKKKKLI